MLFSTIFNTSVLLSLFGYSAIFKRFLYHKNIYVLNIDALYGIFLLFLISILLNFFFPLIYFFFPVLLIGIVFFIKFYFEKKIKINFYTHFLFLFFLSFISYSNGENVDSPMYHLQIIKWTSLEKIIFGMTNIEIRFGINSLWFNFLSLFSFELNNFKSILVLNFIPFTIFFYEIYSYKKKIICFSNMFLALCFFFLIIFSYLHPFNNGVILNHLTNPELDTVSAVFFILSFYLFFKCGEQDKSYSNFKLLLLSSLICFFTKVSYVYVLILPFFIFYFYLRKNIFLISKLNLITLFLFILWLLKGYIISSCFIFPIKFSCIYSSWSSIEEVDHYSKVIRSYARDTGLRLNYGNFDYTINTYDWFDSWVHNYFLKNAILTISSVVIFASVLLSYISFLAKIKISFSYLDIKKYLLTFLIIIIGWLFWFQAPDTRFAWGLVISTSCFFFLVFLFHLKFYNFFDVKKINILIIFMILLMISKNINNLKINYIIKPYKKVFDNSEIKKIGNFNNFEVYNAINSKCYDFTGICVNKIKNSYSIYRINGYLFFLN